MVTMASRKYTISFSICVALLTLLAQTATGGDKRFITETNFNTLISSQDLTFQNYLSKLFPDSECYQVTGPLDPLYDGPGYGRDLYNTVRVICPDHTLLEDAIAKFHRKETMNIVGKNDCLTGDCENRPGGYRGALIELLWKGDKRTVQFNSIQQTRWLIWALDNLLNKNLKFPREKLELYSRELSNHLFAAGRGWKDFPMLKIQQFGIPAKYDFYYRQPDAAIPGPVNFKSMKSNDAIISTDFAHGILAFIPGDSLLTAMTENAPPVVYLNREAATIQHEFSRFIYDGGDFRIFKTLTSEAFQSLEPGEYLFAVGLSGKIRYTKRHRPAETSETNKTSRPELTPTNYAFLFPGEMVLSAGLFIIDASPDLQIVELFSFSSRYFYKRGSQNLNDNTPTGSNDNILSLGHFFWALDKIDISTKNILIRKM